mmetsp:Transcript_33345/g.71035  ORF Transcript_33345/g.71035 Transcript_33345/m.71035 type:complete len:230 (+) Transcript_33345:402-1091(+)
MALLTLLDIFFFDFLMSLETPFSTFFPPCWFVDDDPATPLSMLLSGLSVWGYFEEWDDDARSLAPLEKPRAFLTVSLLLLDREGTPVPMYAEMKSSWEDLVDRFFFGFLVAVLEPPPPLRSGPTPPPPPLLSALPPPPPPLAGAGALFFLKLFRRPPPCCIRGRGGSRSPLPWPAAEFFLPTSGSPREEEDDELPDALDDPDESPEEEPSSSSSEKLSSSSSSSNSSSV